MRFAVQRRAHAVIRHVDADHTAQICVGRNILAGNAVLDRVADRRAVFDAGDVAAHAGGVIFEQFDQSTAQGLAGLDVARQDDELADVAGRQLLVEAKVVTRRA